MQVKTACVKPLTVPDKREAAYKSGTHQKSEDWNVLALSNGRWKLPDD